MKTLKEFEADLAAAVSRVPVQLEIAADKVGTLTLTLAQHYPGTYQPGWAPLAESTLKDKASKGYPVPSPLKRTGEMAESYHKTLVPEELAVVVSSPEKKALWQEMGTSRIPPRPVLRLALHNALPFGRDVLRKISASLVSRRSIDK